MLVCWSVLSIADLREKSGLSKSQLHTTLNNLQAENIAQLQSRGLYSLTDNPFTKNLKEAYKAKMIDVINLSIYHIKQQLKNKLLKEAEVLYVDLLAQYDPLLNEHFPYIISSLAKRFIEAYK